MNLDSLYKKIIFTSTVFIMGIFLGFIISKQNIIKKNTDNFSKENSQYKYINPLLYCSDIENFSNKEIADTKKEIQKNIENFKNKGVLKDISVYFRDLNNGPWFGINEKEEFTPGSLLKVPLMLAILKHSESNPDFLNTKVNYKSGSVNFIQEFKPKQEIKIGNNYNLQDLLYYTITYSDNNAASLLSDVIPRSSLVSIYSELGLIKPQDNSDYKITVRDYSSFFRILYNSTYINEPLSDYALKLLSESKFEDGLVKNIPKNIFVSHKFGERVDGNIKQLHDCGIIYYPNHPYVLCVMTRGYNMQELAKIISSISDTVYRKISN